MKEVKWYINRIKAMNFKELLWRFEQKKLQHTEKNVFYNRHLPVTQLSLPDELFRLTPHVNNIAINWDNSNYTLFEKLNIFDAYDYHEFRNHWNAGFQTSNEWSQSDFSYDININQREDIGDIRTNWELNRHYQFSALAKSYYLSGEIKYLDELIELFYDWNHHNLFLHGVEWTSSMEIAIRINSWIYTYCYLEKAGEKYNNRRCKELLNDLSRGILFMTMYVIDHRSRYSSANNHLIIEMYAVAISGVFYDNTKWLDFSINVMTEELQRQNYKDGVNKEMSLHYQCFVMEAYGLLINNMNNQHIYVPDIWFDYLENMSEFLCDCIGIYGEVIIFGDNDEGKILDLSGTNFNYYQYILELMSCVLSRKFTELDICTENIHWLVNKNQIELTKIKRLYTSTCVRHYREGGYTLLRSENREVLIGIDHGALGFGSIAAHGHADALSFQMYVKGKPVFADPGTYNYHVPKLLRDVYRSTGNHNTISVNGSEQSQLLGPFMWGKKAVTRAVRLEKCDTSVQLIAETTYCNIIHRRTFIYDFQTSFIIQDKLTSKSPVTAYENVILGNGINAERAGRRAILTFDDNCIEITCDKGEWQQKSGWYSPHYNHKVETAVLYVKMNDKFYNMLKISIKRKIP